MKGDIPESVLVEVLGHVYGHANFKIIRGDTDSFCVVRGDVNNQEQKQQGSGANKKRKAETDS